jgi:hypothetical protein
MSKNIVRYYKSTDAALLEALTIHDDQVNVLLEEGKKFAEGFGGLAIYYNTLSEFRIADLVAFPMESPIRVSPLWTRPDPKNNRAQRPRRTLQRATAEEKLELIELREKWVKSHPTKVVSFAPVLKAMGTEWGDLLFHSFSYFQHDGLVYVGTSAPLNDGMVEILGSEFDTAKVAMKAGKENDN